MSKAKRPNRIYGREKNKQIQELKQHEQEKRDAHIQKMKKQDNYDDGRSIFDFVAKYKIATYSALTIIAVLAFVVGPAYYAAIQGGPGGGPVAGASNVLATWRGGEITQGEAIRMQEEGQRLQYFYSELVTNAVTHKTKDFLQGETPDFNAFQEARMKELQTADPWQIAGAPSDPVTVKFLSTIAYKHGMGITAKAIADHIEETLYQNNTTEQIKEAKEAAFEEQLTKEEIAEKLIPYVSARKLQRLADTGIPLTPNLSDRAVTHKLLTDKYQFEIIEIPVNVTDSDDYAAADLNERFTAFKEIFVDETGLNRIYNNQGLPNVQEINNQRFHAFGVRTPRKFGYQYVAFNEDAYDRLAQVQLEESVTEEELQNYYETNIEQYIAPAEVLDQVDKEAGDNSEPGETSGEAEGENTDEEAPDAEEPAAEQSKNGNTDEDADCLILFQDENEKAKEESPANSEPEATEDTPPEPTEENAEKEETEDNEAPAEPVEDLSVLDTPIPLEPNVVPEPPKTYKPFEEVKEEVRDEFIRTAKFEKKKQLLDADKLKLTEAMNAFASADDGNNQTRTKKLAKALDQDQKEYEEDAAQIKAEAEAELARVVAEINQAAEGVLAENTVNEESLEAEQIVLAVSGQTDTPISAAYGQAIAGRNPDAVDFGFAWDDTTPSWVKLVRTGYKAHGGPGTSSDSDLFLESDLLTPHETDSFQSHTYIFWQVVQTKESDFNDGLENADIRKNTIQSLNKSTALLNAQETAQTKAEGYSNGDDASLKELMSNDENESYDYYTTFPTSMFTLSQFNLQQGGVELATLQKAEVVTEVIEAAQSEPGDEETVSENQDESTVETKEVDSIERKELRPTVTVSDIDDSSKIRMFQSMQVNTAIALTAPTGRKVYVVRKMEYNPSANDPSLPMNFFAPAEFEQLVRYLADGRVSARGGMGSITMGPTALATDNMYRSQQGGGIVTQLSRGFIALLQKEYDYKTPQAPANQ
jgi:predicted house-cleaning noncanonical NTP pyrophosphatase (MazG superfamily)